MEQIRLVAIDLDGTLFDDNKEISKRNMQAMRAAAQQGVYVAICSGRIYKTAAALSRKIAPGQPYISCNGAILGFNDRAEFISCTQMTDLLAAETLKVARDAGCEVHVHTKDGAMAHLHSRTKAELFRGQPQVDADGVMYPLMEYDELLAYIQGQTIKFVIMDEDPKKLRAVRDALCVHEDLFITSSWHSNLEIMAKGADKGSGVTNMAKALGVPLSQVMVIGDNENDEAMFRVAGLAVAMGNAVPSIKALSHVQTLDCNHSGVGAAIEEYVLKPGLVGRG